MRLFVTGGCGFIGSNFVLHKLNDSKNTILNYDSLTYAGNKENLKSAEGFARYELVKGSICDSDLLFNTIDRFKPHAIVHFAAESHVDRSIDNPMSFVETNVLGTAILLNMSFKFLKNNPNKKFRFIHISTDEVYGSLEPDEFFTENTNYDPSSPYSASKASSDHLVKAWHKTFNFPAIITNCSNNYGPYQFPEKLIPLIIANCCDLKPLPVYGSGENVRDWLYVEDHCHAISRVIEKGVFGETYNIGGNNQIKNIDIVETICKIMDDVKPRKDSKKYSDLITFVKDRPGHDLRYAIDASKIKNNLGWTPKEVFESGIKKTIEWYIENEIWWRRIQKNITNKKD